MMEQALEYVVDIKNNEGVMDFNDLEKVKTVNDLSDFIRNLSTDFSENEDKWNNINIEDYLEAISAWITDIQNTEYFKENKLGEISPTVLEFIAAIFYMGKIQE